jgi:cytidylate kinase
MRRQALVEANIPVITIDGPSGTGKGTISLHLAERLGWNFLDSGALYRVLAYAALQEGISLDDEQALARRVDLLSIDFRQDPAAPGENRVVLDGVDITDAIRTEDCAAAASQVAALPRVRQALLSLQRAFRKAPGLVADGRDMGTVVFPGAGLKIFLYATPEERAGRRYKQLKEKGVSVNVPQLLRDIAERDARDSQRAVSPLKPASDASIIDTTGIGIEAVFERVMRLVNERISTKGS